MKQDPILITGCARSGTSLVAGIIDRCGAFGGGVLGPTPHNKRGQYENREIVDRLVKPYLRIQHLDPMCQKPLPDPQNLLPYDNLEPEVRRILREDGYQDGPWYYKTAKACLMWPIWHKAFPKAKWVIVRRETEEIVESCMRTGFMRKRSTREEWREWVRIHELRFQEMIDAEAIDVEEVWPREFFVGDFLRVRDMIEWLGLEWKGDEVIEFVSPALWNGGENHG